MPSASGIYRCPDSSSHPIAQTLFPHYSSPVPLAAGGRSQVRVRASVDHHPLRQPSGRASQARGGPWSRRAIPVRRVDRQRGRVPFFPWVRAVARSSIAGAVCTNRIGCSYGDSRPPCGLLSGSFGHAASRQYCLCGRPAPRRALLAAVIAAVTTHSFSAQPFPISLTSSSPTKGRGHQPLRPVG